MFGIVKPFFRTKEVFSPQDMYFLREIMRKLLVAQNIPIKGDRLFLDRMFANLHFMGDETMLRSRFVRAFYDEVDAVAARYMDAPIDANSELTFNRQMYEDVRVGRCKAIYQLAQCVIYNNPTLIRHTPAWFDDGQVVREQLFDTRRGGGELKMLSNMTRRMPLALDIDEEEKRFLYLLLSHLYLINDTKSLKFAVVEKVDFNGLLERYPTENPELFDLDVRLGKVGESEVLLCLAREIISANHQRIVHDCAYSA